MKLLKFLTVFVTILSLGGAFYSCSDDDDKIEAITLKDLETTEFKFIYPNTSEAGYSYSLKGGDGNYSIKSNNDEVVTAKMISATEFRIDVIGLGKTTITITDNSQNALNLGVVIDYQIRNFVVIRHDIKIVGGDLTENEKKAISEKHLAEIPVKVHGGYKFVYSETPYDRGKATVYANVYGGSEKTETTFEMEKVEKEDYPELDIYGSAYVVDINNEKRKFLLGKYIPSTRMTEKIIGALMEDITAKVQQEYPKAELVYTSQVVELVTY